MSVHLSPLFSDGMVLQRGSAARLWGRADEPVTVTFVNQTVRAVPDAAGSWHVTLRDLAPGGPYTLTVNEHTLRDVYVGDVWVLAGQSNMQLPMGRARHMYPEEFTRENPNIRQFIVPQRTDFRAPRAELAGGRWAGASQASLADFSAVGYFFAKRLYARYKTPVGLLLTAIGGTPIHAWMGRAMLNEFADLQASADQCADDAYVARVQARDAAETARFFDSIDQTDPGLAGGWHLPAFDDSGWEERPLLAPWEGSGSVWLRRAVEIPPALAGKPATLFLGTVTDWDAAYINGELAGSTVYRYPPREYAVPSLPQGRCGIAVRVISQNGGRFTHGKQYLLSAGEGAFNLNGTWRFHRGGHAEPPAPETFFHYKPTGLYNGMIAPLQRFRVRGALWYQGESDAANPARYAEKLIALINGWRAGWGEAFPFLFVELPHWGEADWRALRERQWQALSAPRTAMAAAFDLGEHNDLHPLGKQVIGDRLARCAMRVAYGEALPPSPFEITGMRDGAL